MVSKIYRRANWGVQKYINEYSKLIQEIIEPEKLVKTILKEHSKGKKENMDFITQLVLSKFLEHQDKISAIFTQTFLQGNRRVVRLIGKRKIPIKPVSDTKAVNFLLQNQSEYLQKLAKDTQTTIEKILAEGIENGLSYNEISEQLTQKVKDLAKNRAEVIAKSEITKAHNYGIMQTFIENDIKKYKWVAKLDKHTCPICRNLHGKEFYVGQGVLPVKDTHPNCRCVVVPVL